MLSHQDNETLVRVGPETPMGSLFRLFWIPFFFSKDIVVDGQPKRVMLLGEDLVAFRDSRGRVGLMANACAHRGAPCPSDLLNRKPRPVSRRGHLLPVWQAALWCQQPSVHRRRTRLVANQQCACMLI